MTNAIVTERLTKYYQSKAVVRDVTLQIPTGTVYGLLGRNGAGKSTLIKMLLGMVHPDRGRATLLGDHSENLKPATRARIAYLAENHPLYKWMTIEELIRFTRPFYSIWNEEFLRGILDHFALSSRSKIRRLSNGQRAQVSLAIALAPDPELLILDDPTLGLDTVVRRDFLESMVQLIQRRGRTILLSSHILGDVERIADRIGIMMDGVLRVDCPLDTFKQTVRRIIIDWPGEPVSLSTRQGVVSERIVGRRSELVTVGSPEEYAEAAISLGAITTDIVEMNLEDAFIAYTRGIPKPLPQLSQEAQLCSAP
ncbi:ABC transporter ATP-binding protein [bacterium]|nr:ABC transporter ATP-binding protein [bacterium]